VDGLWATQREGVGIIVRAINFQDFQAMWSSHTDGQTDRQTDGQTTCNHNTAMCTTAHRAVKIRGVGPILINQKTITSFICTHKFIKRFKTFQ